MLKPIPAPKSCRQAGSTLIEVLVTLLILSIGLLGLAGMQLAGQQSVMESYQRDQAMTIVQDMVQRINANRSNIACYASASYFGTDSTGTGFVAANACAASAQAVTDMTEWSKQLFGAAESGNTGAMIGARGCITYDAATRTAIVSVAWQGLSGAAGQPDLRGRALCQRIEAARLQPSLENCNAHMKSASRRQSRPARHQSGFSLIELMVAIAIGLFLVAAVTMLIVQQSGTRDETDKSSQLIENGRYAIQLLQNEIEHAGFYGTYSPQATATYSVPADPCSTALADQGWDASTGSLPVSIYGYAGASTNPAPSGTTCATGITNYQPNTGILVVRRTATTPVPAAAAVAGTTYLQTSRCSTDAARFAFASSSAGFTLNQKDCATAAPLYPYVVRVFYISSCDVCSPSDNIPTLKVIEFTGGAQTTLALAAGIESMQFDYGVANSSSSLPPASYTTAPAAADWANVVAVKINLLARNMTPSPGYTDGKTYTLAGGSTVSPGGAYKRHVFSETVRVINVSERRE
jgi:type IV pilus assembly protein PilW